MARSHSTILVVPALLALAGCGSISASSESVSDSVNNALDSVSDSSTNSSNSSSGGGGSEQAQNYRRDVYSYSVAWLESSDREPPQDEFARGLGRVAELHGVTDWQASVDTRQALAEVAHAPEVDAAQRARLRGELSLLGIDLQQCPQR